MGPGVTTALEKEGSKPCLWHSLAISGMPEPRGGGSLGLAPQFFADQLTLFQPKRAYSAHPLLLAPPNFFTFWHRCKYYKARQKK